MIDEDVEEVDEEEEFRELEALIQECESLGPKKRKRSSNFAIETEGMHSVR